MEGASYPVVVETFEDFGCGKKWKGGCVCGGTVASGNRGHGRRSTIVSVASIGYGKPFDASMCVNRPAQG